MKRTCYAAVRALLLLCLLLSLAVPAFADGMVQTEPLAYTDGRFTPGDGVRGYFLTAVPGAAWTAGPSGPGTPSRRRPCPGCSSFPPGTARQSSAFCPWGRRARCRQPF